MQDQLAIELKANLKFDHMPVSQVGKLIHWLCHPHNYNRELMNHDRKRANESMQQIFYERMKFFGNDFKLICVDGTYINESIVEDLPYQRERELQNLFS